MDERDSNLGEALVETLRPLIVAVVREELARLPHEAPSPYLTVPEAAAYLGAKPQRVYDLRSDGRLTRFKDGSRALVARAELDQYLGGRGYDEST